MRILLLAATPAEVAATAAWLDEVAKSVHPLAYQHASGVRVDLLITGVGLPVTALYLGRALQTTRYDLCVQAGVAGALDQKLEIGQVVEVASDRFADLGAEDRDGSWLSLAEIGLAEVSGLPAGPDGILRNPASTPSLGLARVHALSRNRASGRAETIERLRRHFPKAQIESMEGASFFLCGLTSEVPMLQLRAISNFVEPRNRANWNLPLAIKNLNQSLQTLLTAFFEQSTTMAR